MSDCIIKAALLLLFGLGLVGSGMAMKKTPPVFVQIAVGVALIIWAYFEYTKCKKECDLSKWSSLALIVPSDFIADEQDVTLCKAQEKAGGAFIACLKDSSKETYDVMYLQGTSFKGTETACTDCKIYFTKDFKVTLDPEKSEENTDSACPINPYPYCSRDDIDQVFVNMNCHASTSLIKKLISEDKLDGYDDPRIVKCCETPEVCRANGVRAFPTVKCANSVVIQGFCP